MTQEVGFDLKRPASEWQREGKRKGQAPKEAKKRVRAKGWCGTACAAYESRYSLKIVPEPVRKFLGTWNDCYR